MGAFSTEPSQEATAAWLTSPERRAALVIAHPAHEIRVLHWLMLTRPRAYVLTQGARSGHDGTRRQASDRMIAALGACVAPWGGAWDKDIYNFVMKGDAAPFIALTDELTLDLIARETDLVVADGWQYYNLAHDLTHLMARIAALRASTALKREIVLVDYPVVPDELAPHATHGRAIATLELTADHVAQKRAAITAIPDIAHEAMEIEQTEGDLAHAREVLQQPLPLEQLLATPSAKPHYESFGEERVAAGIYKDVVRWSHVSAICNALAKHYGL
ncbi:MAG: hypothetical protein J0L81_03380 [Caulobacterales bacterium]|nr:hypothetical protein [Caulobacterales bacterium]